MHLRFKQISLSLLLILGTLTTSLHAEFKGKLDVAPTYVHIDVLESGKTRHRMDLPAIKIDSSIFFTEGGWCLKPNLLYGSKQGNLFSGGLGFGHYTPLTEWFSLTPVVGAIYSKLHATTSVEIPVLGSIKSREAFSSVSGFVALEANLNFSDTFRCAAVYQYAWSRSHTRIKLNLPAPLNVVKSNDHCEGPSYSVLLEKDLCKQWSVNLGAAYNLSLSKERHGLRGYGVKLGIAYWF